MEYLQRTIIASLHALLVFVIFYFLVDTIPKSKVEYALGISIISTMSYISGKVSDKWD